MAKKKLVVGSIPDDLCAIITRRAPKVNPAQACAWGEHCGHDVCEESSAQGCSGAPHLAGGFCDNNAQIQAGGISQSDMPVWRTTEDIWKKSGVFYEGAGAGMHRLQDVREGMSFGCGSRAK